MGERSLRAYELSEAKTVFLSALNYDAIRLRERNRLALIVAKGWSRLTRRPDPKSNAMTLGNTILFSRNLRTDPSDSRQDRLTDMAWLIHELTHVWQFQRYRWKYLSEAVGAHAKQGANPYVYSRANSLAGKGEDLRVMWNSQKRFGKFNREQQGDIVRDYYRAIKRQIDTSGWDPYVAEMRSVP